MQGYDIIILTDSNFLEKGNPDPHKKNILTEDRLVQDALEKRGMKVGRTHWDNPDMDWKDTRYIMFRSTWDYFDRFPEFDPWLEKVSKLCAMINPYDTIRWNLDKHYLLELADQGIHIPPTRFIEQGEQQNLKELCTEAGWDEIILKPVVSGAARHTYRFKPHEAEKYQEVFLDLLVNEAMMIQEFQDRVPEEGEYSFVLIGGTFTHAMLKKARKGDFRVQDDFGGTLHPYDPSDEEIALAERVGSKCRQQALYARVDLIRDKQGRLAVSELELIEPELWFRFNPDAAERLADTFIAYDQNTY